MIRVIILSSVLLWVAGCTNSSVSSEQFRLVKIKERILQPSRLMQAVQAGDESAMKTALLAGDSVNAVYQKNTPLRFAMLSKQVRIANILLRAGAEPDWALEQTQASVLMLASRNGLNALVEAFIQRGYDLNYIDGEGQSALSEAALAGHLTTVNILLNAGASTDVEINGQSLLMRLVASNSMLIVKPILEVGVDVNFVSRDGDSALSIARKKQLHELDLMLVQSGARL